MKMIRPETFHRDFIARGPLSLPRGVDVYLCGFPCQPFSPSGLGRGAQDERGQHCISCLEVIAATLPKVFVLENVENILSFPEVISFIIETLRSLGEYEVHYTVLGSSTHGGVPHHRERVFIVGLLTKEIRIPFRWPVPIPMKPLTALLENTAGEPSLLLSMSATKKKNLLAILELHGNATTDSIADLGASRLKVMHDVCPCLLATRTGDQAYWSLRRLRPLKLTELIKLQGFQPAWFDNADAVISDRQLGNALGNAITATILERVLRQLFISMGWPLLPSEFDGV